MNIPIGYAILGWLLLIIVNVIYDAKHYAKINHGVELVLRIGVGIIYAWLMFHVKHPDFYATSVVIWMATSFYLFFELLLNLAKGLHLLHLGTTARIDRFIREYLGGQRGYIFLKLATLILFIASSIWIINP